MIVIGADTHKGSHALAAVDEEPARCAAAARSRRTGLGTWPRCGGRASLTRSACGRSRTAARVSRRLEQALLAAGERRDWRGSRLQREAALPSPEPLVARGMADQDRGGQRAATVLAKQSRSGAVTSSASSAASRRRGQDQKGRAALAQTPPRPPLPPVALRAARRPTANLRARIDHQARASLHPRPTQAPARGRADRRRALPDGLHQLNHANSDRPLT